MANELEIKAQFRDDIFNFFLVANSFYLHRTIDRHSLEANFHVFARHFNALDRQKINQQQNLQLSHRIESEKHIKHQFSFFFGMCVDEEKKRK